jgi:hypothetical protein
MTAASDGTSVPERPDPGSAPWYRNPFVISFVAGVLTLTWLHFRLRHVPEPPPELGRLASVDWVGAESAPNPIGRDVVLVAFFDPETGKSCGGVRLLGKILPRLEDAGVDATMAVVAYGGVAAEKGFRRAARGAAVVYSAWIGGPADQQGVASLEAWFTEGAARSDDWRGGQPRPYPPAEMAAPPACDGARALGSVALVDAEGDLRGVFGAWEWEVESEITHRTRHVVEAGAVR